MQKSKVLYKELLKQLNYHKRSCDLFSNPVQLLSLDILKRLLQKKLSIKSLDNLIQFLCMKGLYAKTKQFQKYLGELDFTKNISEVRKCFQQMACKSSFAQFVTQIEQVMFGVVVTAHPTFSISEDLAKMLAQMVSTRKFSKSSRNLWHKPDQQITLNYEHKISLQAITNIQVALHGTYNIIFDVVRKHYPKQWYKLIPRLITAATWVGYDLDGRIDITWSDTLYMRMESAILQLNRYVHQCKQILEIYSKDSPGGQKCHNILQEIYNQLFFTRDVIENEILFLSEYIKNKTDFSPLLQLKLSNDNNNRLLDLSALSEKIGFLCKTIKNRNVLSKLFVLNAEMMNYGLGMAHIHVRINAISCHNAIHENIKIERLPENLAEQQYYAEALNKLLEHVVPVVINLGDLIQEQTSVKRLFMVLVYIFKYIDAVTPVRFLIAEVENACSVLTVLYYAKLFGIENKIDISPLFETEHGIHHGVDIIKTLLDNPFYYSYIKTRKKLCIQTGFSDSGRYIGQITATLALERLRAKIARLFTEYDLKDIQLVIFDTHGESIGRGNHPRGFDTRIDYILTPFNRRLFKELNISLTHETSFQGGDGYLFFKNKEIALATITRLLQNNLQQNPKEQKEVDPFYADNAYAFSFFFAVKGFHEQLFNDKDYAVLLNIYRNNMLYATGSRTNKRQYDLVSTIDYDHPSQMRAIPHNAILQQLGFLLNTVSGLGQIVQKDPEKFVMMYKTSGRFRNLISMVVAADQLSSFDVVNSYIELLNPEYWLRIAEDMDKSKNKGSLLKLAALLESDHRFESLRRVIRTVKMDKVKFYSVFKDISNKGRDLVYPKEYRDYLDLLHAIRIALIQQIFLTITHLPRFSSSPDNITQQDIVKMILHLEIPSALNILRATFPINTVSISYQDFGDTTYSTENYNKDYTVEHKKIFNPMEQSYDLIRQISTGISYFAGGIG